MSETFRAIAERDDDGWVVSMQGLDGLAPFRARDLADVEPRALELVGQTDEGQAVELEEGVTTEDGAAADVDIGIQLEVRLPPSTQVHLNAIRHYFALIDAEYDAAARAMTDEGVPLLDISRVLALYRPTSRPLTVTNAEIAEHGLDRYPDAVGIEWADHGFALTRLCWRHLDRRRTEYRDLDPTGLNAIVYPGREFRCDRCYEGDDFDEGDR